MKLAKYIKDLLLENDKVVLPGLGTFIGKSETSKIDQKTDVLKPPKKIISFDGSRKADDGLLVRHVSKSENISLREARKAIEDFVNDCIRDLSNGKRIKVQKNIFK